MGYSDLNSGLFTMNAHVPCVMQLSEINLEPPKVKKLFLKNIYFSWKVNCFTTLCFCHTSTKKVFLMEALIGF